MNRFYLTLPTFSVGGKTADGVPFGGITTVKLVGAEWAPLIMATYRGRWSGGPAVLELKRPNPVLCQLCGGPHSTYACPGSDADRATRVAAMIEAGAEDLLEREREGEPGGLLNGRSARAQAVNPIFRIAGEEVRKIMEREGIECGPPGLPGPEPVYDGQPRIPDFVNPPPR